jgi:hypothetical protein
MLHPVKVAVVVIVIFMAVKRKAFVTCRLGCVSARITQRGTGVIGARRDIMEILGGYVVGEGSCIAVTDSLCCVNCVNVLIFMS